MAFTHFSKNKNYLQKKRQCSTNDFASWKCFSFQLIEYVYGAHKWQKALSWIFFFVVLSSSALYTRWYFTLNVFFYKWPGAHHKLVVILKLNWNRMSMRHKFFLTFIMEMETWSTPILSLTSFTFAVHKTMIVSQDVRVRMCVFLYMYMVLFLFTSSGSSLIELKLISPDAAEPRREFRRISSESIEMRRFAK